MRTSPLLFASFFATVSLGALAGCSRETATNRMAGLPPAYDDAPSSEKGEKSESKEAESPVAQAPKRVTVPLARVGLARQGASVALARIGTQRVAFVADEDESAIRTIDVEGGRELAVTKLPGRPSQLVVSKEGSLFVGLRDGASVAVYGATDDASATLEPLASIATATEPVGLTLTDDDATLLVVSGWDHALEVFDAASHERRLRASLEREPRAVVASKDGSRAFVAHASSGQMSVVDLRVASADAPATKTLNMGSPAWTETAPGREFGCILLNFMVPIEGVNASLTPPRQQVVSRRFDAVVTRHPARFARQGFAIARLEGKKGDRILMPDETIATGDASVSSSGYGGGGFEGEVPEVTEAFDVGVVDALTATRVPAGGGAVAFADRQGEGACKLPRAAVTDDTTHTMYVSCTGNSRVIAYGGEPLKSSRTWKLGAGVTGLALDENNALVAWSQFEHALYAFSTNETKKGEAAPAPRKIALPRAAEGALFSALALEGRSLFHASNNPNVSFDGRACATCHPDGRDDGLVWSTPEGPRQTIFLAGRVKREAPFGWRGQHTSVREHMKDTIKNLKGKGLTDHEQDALDAYLTELKGPSLRPASTRPERAELSALEARGRTLFRGSDTGCATCHAEKDGFSDREAHDVQSASPGDRHKAFLAPSLRFVGESGPWFHDGRYASLAELLEKSDGKMGSTAHLSKPDIQALEAYLRTL